MPDFPQPTMFGQWIKRQAEIAAAVGVLLGGMAAVVAFFGGSVPPWYTPAKAAEDQRTNAKIQEQTVQAIGQVTRQLNTMQRRLDIKDCNGLAATLGQAQDALRRKPGDPIAQALRDATELQMRQIQNCAP